MDASVFEVQLHRARRGDKDCADRLFLHFAPVLLRRAQRLVVVPLRPKVDADDLLQDTFLAAWSCFDQFQGTTPAEFSAWLRRILASQLSRSLRRYRLAKGRDFRLERRLSAGAGRSSHGPAEPHSPGTTPSQHAARAELVGRVDGALESLPAHYRFVLDGHERKGLSLKDIAVSLGRSEEAVRKL
jgi:RNA polymerase sigma-70 factor (ECF subfamily)